jgi:biotin carboxylase
MSLPRPVLQVGYTPVLVAQFSRFLPENSLAILDEPDPVRKRNGRQAVDQAPVCRCLIEEEFLRPGGADRFFLHHLDLDPVAVMPANDYAVPAAARIADRFGVASAGLGAAEILRDKHLLRVVASAAGIANPVSRPVKSATEVAAFQAGLGGPVIIKPANRQAAIGTLIVRDPAGIPAAWQDCLDQEEENSLPDRSYELQMLAEQVVTGAEYSVEMLYGNGKRYFANVTAKVLISGSRPVELGHLVPAPIPRDLAGLLAAETERLLVAIGFGAGLVHCEWIVQDGVPYLVECAGRQPGDYINELISGAYGFDFDRAYADLMRGDEPDCPSRPARGAASWHGVAAPGEVISIDGVEQAAALPGVERCTATVTVGGFVPPLRSSWGRTAAVTAFAATALQARDIARRAVDMISVETKPREPYKG